eukprot:TRINITY_DN9712_c0_g3_i1.p1 TRINITY_DN9712_c0_g3~~TRINITY_DN9712_c0_g3_i1.p1  ORF type:complete len:723 (+),score=158.27 TRINITY_DN9712_c0_g3_i1:111-2279(+)
MNFEPVLQSLFNPPKVEILTNVEKVATEVNKHWTIASTLRSTTVKNWKDDEYDSFTELGKYHGHKVCVEYHRNIVKNISIVGLGALCAAISVDKVLLEKISCKLDGSASAFLFHINSINIRTDFARREDSLSKFYKRHTCECFSHENGAKVLNGTVFTVDDGSPIEVLEIGGFFLNEQADGNLRFESITVYSSRIRSVSIRCQRINSLLCQRWTMIKALVNEGQLPRIEDVGIEAFNSALKNHPFFTELKFALSTKNLRRNEYAISSILLSEYAATCSNGSNILDMVNPFNMHLYLTPDIANIPVEFKQYREPLMEFNDLDCAEFAEFESLLAPSSSNDDNSSFYFASPVVQPSFDMNFVDNASSIFDNFNQQYGFDNDQALFEQLLKPTSPSQGMMIGKPSPLWSSQYSNEWTEDSIGPQVDEQSYYMGEPSIKRHCYSDGQKQQQHQMVQVPRIDESKSHHNNSISDQQLALLKMVLENGSSDISPELRKEAFKAFNTMTNLVQKQKSSSNSKDHKSYHINPQQQQLIEKSHLQQSAGNHYNSFACSDGEPMIVDESNITVPSTPSISSQYSSSSSSSLSPIRSSSIPIPPKQPSVSFQCLPSTLPSIQMPPKPSSPVSISMQPNHHSSLSFQCPPSTRTLPSSSIPEIILSNNEKPFVNSGVSFPQQIEAKLSVSVPQEQIQGNLRKTTKVKSARYGRKRYPKKRNPVKKVPQLAAGPS